MSSYQEALEAAGIEVLAFQNFGSYQGDWWAKVQVGNDIGFIGGSFGSCSYCDSLLSEIGYQPYGLLYGESDLTEEDKQEIADYQNRLKSFGESYISNLMSKEEALKKASENIEWDLDAEEMVNWIREQ